MMKWIIAVAMAMSIAAPFDAVAQVVVVVGANSKIDKLNLEQVNQLFLEKIGTFPSGEQAYPLDMQEGPLRDEFYSKVAKKTSRQIRAYWSNMVFSGKGVPLKSFKNEDDLKKKLNSDPNSIGYMEKKSVDSTVKAVLVP